MAKLINKITEVFVVALAGLFLYWLLGLVFYFSNLDIYLRDENKNVSFYLQNDGVYEGSLNIQLFNNAPFEFTPLTPRFLAKVEFQNSTVTCNIVENSNTNCTTYIDLQNVQSGKSKNFYIYLKLKKPEDFDLIIYSRFVMIIHLEKQQKFTCKAYQKEHSNLINVYCSRIMN